MRNSRLSVDVSKDNAHVTCCPYLSYQKPCVFKFIRHSCRLWQSSVLERQCRRKAPVTMQIRYGMLFNVQILKKNKRLRCRTTTLIARFVTDNSWVLLLLQQYCNDSTDVVNEMSYCLVDKVCIFHEIVVGMQLTFVRKSYKLSDKDHTHFVFLTWRWSHTGLARWQLNQSSLSHFLVDVLTGKLAWSLTSYTEWWYFNRRLRKCSQFLNMIRHTVNS